MSGNDRVDSLLNHDVLAFEYVTGVMRGDERVQFENLLKINNSLAEQVRFWEEQLIQLTHEEEQRQPDADTWHKISTRMNQQLDKQETTGQQRFNWPQWLVWATTSIAIVFFAASIFLFSTSMQVKGPNADYVAVLTDTSGTPHLTVLTATKGVALWLKWDGIKIPKDKNIQLWAVSKRDGQTRPLAVFAHTDATQLPLTTANWRLIKDAETLILTEEDVGGSPLDEPSDVILAKGACVLLVNTEKTI